MLSSALHKGCGIFKPRAPAQLPVLERARLCPSVRLPMKLAEACSVLGLPSTPVPEDDAIRKAFRREALKHHPDKNIGDEAGAAERFQRVKAASECVVRYKKRGGEGGPGDGAPAEEEDGDDAFADFMASGRGDEAIDEVLMELFERVAMQDYGHISPKQRKQMKKAVAKMRQRAKLDAASAAAEKKRRAALEAREADEKGFWTRQYAAGGRSLRDGGGGCYLSWQPKALLRELRRRKIALPRKQRPRDLADRLLEDDESAASTRAAGETGLVVGAAADAAESAAPSAPEGWKDPVASTGDRIYEARKKRKREAAAARAVEEDAARDRTCKIAGGAFVAVVVLVLAGFL